MPLALHLPGARFSNLEEIVEKRGIPVVRTTESDRPHERVSRPTLIEGDEKIVGIQAIGQRLRAD